MNQIQEQLVKAIKHRMVDMGINGKELCRRSGVSQPMWSEVSTGKKSPSIETVVALTAAVGLHVEYRLVPKQEEDPCTFPPGTTVDDFKPQKVDYRKCNQHLREGNKSYPKTCAVCKLGPCQNPHYKQ